MAWRHKVLVSAFLFFSILSFAQEENPVQVDSILSGPDHADMSWKVHFSDPRLMYQQQYLLEVRSRIPAELLDIGGKPHTLHFVAKVQDSQGHWLDGEQYNRFEPTAKLGDSKDIECSLAIYLRPGDYTVAMIAYDGTTNKTNVVRKKVSVRELSGDPLPDFNAHLPAADFPDDFPDQELARGDKSDGELFSIGHQLSPYPITNKGSIRIDVVLNISKQENPRVQADRIPTGLDRDMGRMDPPWERRHRRDTVQPSRAPYTGFALGRVLQSASVLSRLAPTNGCVFVTAVDPVQMKVALPTVSAATLDWNKTQSKLEKFDQNMIDARVLQNHKGPGMFLHDLLEQISDPSSSCGAEPVSAHYVVVVSPALSLPEFNNEMRVSEVAGERARFYYFHTRSENPYSDDLSKLLKPAKTRQLEYSDPLGFRKALANFLADVRAAN